MARSSKGVVHRASRAQSGRRLRAAAHAVWAELLEGRAMLSAPTGGGIDEAPFGSPRMLAHAAHVRHVGHLRHLRQPGVTTDQSDYQPGQKATIAGHGFRAGERVRVTAAHVDGPTGASPVTWDVTADASGQIHTSYLVRNSDWETSLELTAVGRASGKVAKATFTDGTTATTTTVSSSTAAAAGAPVLRPDHVVVVMEEDRFDNAVGDTANMPYVNQLAGTGLVFNKSLGLNTPSQQGEMDYLGLYSGSTQGVTDNGSGYSFSGANLASSLNTVAGLSFVGYSESLPSDGSQVREAADPVSDPANHPDLYVRNYNPMAMFTNAGPGKTNADVNKTFAEFPTNFASLPTVSLVVPNTLHSTHGSNEAPPWATDTGAYVGLRQAADSWLRQNLDAYVQWAKTHNSLLIVTTDELDRQHPGNGSLTTIVTGDPRLFVAGTDSTSITHYDVLRTVENMYGLTPLGNSATAAGLDVNVQGQLAAPAPAAASVYGQSVTFTARVAAASGTPTGSVQFQIDGANFGSPVVLVNGVATSAAISSLAVGNHSVTAVYGSSGTFAGSTAGALTQSVAKDSTSTALSTSAASVTAGQSVTFTARVSIASPGAATPTGSVTFRDGSTTLATVAVNASGVATFTTSSLAAGSHSITAAYGGDANTAASTSAAVAETVTASSTAASSSTAVTTSVGSSVYGQPVTFAASVSSSAGGTPTGTVQFYVDGAAVGGAVALVNGSASSAAIATMTPGSHAITAAYSGDVAYLGSTSSAATVTVSRAGTTTGVTTSPNPSAAGQTVTFTATVATVSPGAGTATGMVQFVVDGANFGSPVSLSNGVAALAATGLAGGTHTVSATYGGDANFNGSSSTAVTQTVQASGVSNDLFANRTAISGASITASGTNSGATKETGEPNHAGNAGGKSVWWTWTAPSSGGVTIDTSGSSFDTLLGVYTGTSVSALTQVAANDDSLSGGTATSKVTFNVTAGTTYQIAVDGYGGAAGSITLHVNLGASVGAANDNFANRTAITGTSATITASNVGATKETGEPNHAGNAGGKSVWWTWTAPSSGTLTVDTLGSSIDTLLGVYTGSSVSALTQVAANDDSLSGGTTTSKVSFKVTAGVAYQIAVDGYGGASGSITLHLTLA